MGEVRVLERENEPFYTVKSLAERWSLTDRTIKNMIKDGELPSYQFRGARRIAPEDVATFEERRREDRRAAA